MILTRSHYSIPIVICFVLLIAGCSGLSGEPQVIGTLAPETNVPNQPPDRGYPAQQPNLANGAQIFAERCAECHGIGGKGDGPLVLSGEVSAPKDFTNPETTQRQKPSEWFETITNGRLIPEQNILMPPWRNALSEQERWDVALYTYTMSYTQAQLALGKELWATECAECHGDSGRGDGPEMPQTERSSGDLSDPNITVFISDSALYVNTAEGIGEHMPAFSPQLNEEQVQAVVAYTRILSLNQAEIIGAETIPPPQSTEEAATEPGGFENIGSIRGKVTNGTALGNVPPNLAVQFRFTDMGGEIQLRDTIIDPAGNFTFAEVPIASNFIYFVIATYQDRIFASEFLVPQPDVTDYELPLTIYDLTEDPFVVKITEIETNIEPFQVEGMGTGLLVTQYFSYENTSDRAFTTQAGISDGRYAALLIPLPPGSLILTDENNPRYIIARDQYALIDTSPVLPGSGHQVFAQYFMPYTDGAIIEQPVNNTVEARHIIRTTPPTLNILGEGISSLGTNTENDLIVASFESTIMLEPGDVIRYEIAGQPFGSVNTSADSNVVTIDRLVPIIAILAIGFALIFLAITRLRKSAPGKDRHIDALVRQIAQLDEQHEAGQINHDLYRQKRQVLKDRLADLMKKEV